MVHDMRCIEGHNFEHRHAWSRAVPSIDYNDLIAPGNEALLKSLKMIGCFVVRNVVPHEEADLHFEELKAFFSRNPEIIGWLAGRKSRDLLPLQLACTIEAPNAPTPTTITASPQRGFSLTRCAPHWPNSEHKTSQFCIQMQSGFGNRAKSSLDLVHISTLGHCVGGPTTSILGKAVVSDTFPPLAHLSADIPHVAHLHNAVDASSGEGLHYQITPLKWLSRTVT